jgi:hypothetical protein
LEHFIENELLVVIELRVQDSGIESVVARGQGFSTPHLIMKRGEREQRVQSIPLRRFL